MTALDNPVYITPQNSSIFLDVDMAVQSAVDGHDPSVLFDLGNELKARQVMSGVALAKLLTRMKDYWEYFEVDDAFENVIMAEMGLSKQTVRKYVRTWEAIEAAHLPDNTMNKLLGHGIGTLLVPTAAAREGQLSQEDWERIANAENKVAVQEIVREIRGEQTSSGTRLTIFIDDKGTLSCRRGSRGSYKAFGYLDLKIEDEEVQQAINRLINSSGVVER